MRFKKLLISGLIMGMMSLPSLMGTQNLKAQISGSDVSDFLESFVKLFCPETPQKRCKQNVCQTCMYKDIFNNKVNTFQDHMRPQDWDPKTFFAMHDLNGDKYWDEDEVRVSL